MTPDASPRLPVTRASSARTPRRAGGSAAQQRWSRRRGVVSVFAVTAVAGLAAAYVGPLALAPAPAVADEIDPMSLYAQTISDAQRFVAASDGVGDLDRAGIVYTAYEVPKPTPTPEAKAAAASAQSSWSPPFVAPDPGTAQAIGYAAVQARGWGDGEFACLVALWNKESGWRVNAYNKGSGAYGIPQALPGGKMASAGADWETNPATQIAWGLGYISGRYGSPCGAWSHSQAKGWY